MPECACGPCAKTDAEAVPRQRVKPNSIRGLKKPNREECCFIRWILSVDIPPQSALVAPSPRRVTPPALRKKRHSRGGFDRQSFSEDDGHAIWCGFSRSKSETSSHDRNKGLQDGRV